MLAEGTVDGRRGACREPGSPAAGPKAAVALAILAVVGAATLYCWASLVVTIGTFSGSVVARAIGFWVVGAVTSAFAYLIARMARRHDLGVAYRALWICLPVLALGLLSVFGIIASTPLSVV